LKETTFIEQNKRKWAKFEKLSKNNNNDPDEVSELFTEITEDLSYARTFYPRRSVRVYLNQLSQGVFTKLYKQKKQPLGSFKLFWTQKVPLELYRMRYNMLASVIFFFIAVLLGAVSQYFDPEFANLVLGNEYIAITEENITDGNPMGIYGSSPQVSMFFQITINNIRVAFMTFALGIFASLGSYYMLLKNGIMLGTFQWWFKAKGLLLTSFLAIWIHGAFEISAIVIAGAAGITVGNGLLFPKSYSRIQSLVFAAKRGLLIMLSLVPIFIMAGALESFVTRNYQSMPDVLKWAIILGSFGFIIFYYGIYPFMVAKRFPEKVKLNEIPRHIPERKINLNLIRNSNESFSDTIYLFFNKLSVVSSLFKKTVLPIVIIVGIVTFYLHFNEFDYILDWEENLSTFFGADSYFSFFTFFTMPIIIALIVGITYFVNDDNQKNKGFKKFLKYIVKPFVWVYLYGLLIYSVFIFVPFLGILIIFIFGAPIFAKIPGYILIDKKDFFTAFIKSFSKEKNGYTVIVGNNIYFILISIILILILNNPWSFGVLNIIDEFLKDILIVNFDSYRVIINAFNISVYILFSGFIIVLIQTSFVLIFHSSSEKQNAKDLYARLEKFGTRNKNLETELDFE